MTVANRMFVTVGQLKAAEYQAQARKSKSIVGMAK